LDAFAMLMMTKRFFILALCLLTGGCKSLFSPPPDQKVYDLAVPAFPAVEPVTYPGMVVVRAPSWLSYSVMQYRFDYLQPPTRETYAESRWVAQPSEMLQRYLVIALGADQNVRAGCQLRIELDEFLQTFTTPQQNDAVLMTRVDLVTTPGAPALARQRFVFRTPGGSADAAGGVKAHQQNAQKLAVDIREWLKSLNAADGELRRHCAWKESDFQ